MSFLRLSSSSSSSRRSSSSSRPSKVMMMTVWGTVAAIFLAGAAVVEGSLFTFSAATFGADPRQARVIPVRTTEAEGNTDLSRPQVVSLPLIPFHEHRRRLQAEGVNVAALLGSRARPRQYQRRRITISTVEAQSSSYTPEGRQLSDGEQDLVDGHYAAQQVAGLFQGYGTHYVDLWCGTPPQRQTVIVDTGSGITAFPCSGCRNCGVPEFHIDQLFTTDASSTFRALNCNECLRGSCMSGQCHVGQAYQEGSTWDAYEAVDSCYVGGLHARAVEHQEHAPNPGQDDLDLLHAPDFAFDLRFGCQTSVTNLFVTQLADGIMGMDINRAAFWSQMFDAQVIAHKAFSLCYSRSPQADRGGTPAGAMSMGGTDVRFHQDRMVYSSTGSSGLGFYGVHIRKVHLQASPTSGVPVDADHPPLVTLSMTEEELNRGQIIVDSGTTDTYLSRKFGAMLNEALANMGLPGYSEESIKRSEKEVLSLPTIIFQLTGDEAMNEALKDSDSSLPLKNLAKSLDPDHPNDILVAFPPTHYYEYDAESGTYVSRLYVGEGSGGVLGGNFMMGHDVFFDVDNGRIGWAESDCNYMKLVEEFYPTEAHEEPTSPPTPQGGSDGVGAEPGGDDDLVVEPPPQQFCSNLSCQLGFVLLVVSVVGLVATRLVRRSGSGVDRSYVPAVHELELQESKVVQEVDDATESSYRDEPADRFA